MWIIEAGQTSPGYTTMMVGDLFTITRDADTIKYYKNDIQILHTRTLASSTPLYVEASMDGNGATINNITADFCLPFTVTETITSDNCDATGAINLTVTDAVQPVTYNWSNTQTTEDLANASYGIYNLTITDGNVPPTSKTYTYELTNNLSWEYITGIGSTTNPNSLNKTANNQTNNSWASSNNQLTGNGKISFEVTSTTDEFIFGFSRTHHTQGSYYAVGYAWEQYGTTNMWLSTSYNNSVGYVSKAIGDVFSIERIGDTLKYYKNDVPYNHTDTVSNEIPLYLEVSMNNKYGVVNNIKVNFCEVMQLAAAQIINETCTAQNSGQITANATKGMPPYTFSWSNGQNTQTTTGLAAGTYTVTVQDSNVPATTRIAQYKVGVQADWNYTAGITAGTNPNTLTKTAATGNTNSWASSDNELIGDGSISFTVSSTTQEFIFGFSKTPHTEGGYYSIDYAWEQYGSSNMWLSTSYNNSIGYVSKSIGDVFKIARENDTLKYYKNNIQYSHIDVVTNETPLYLEVSIDQTGTSVNNINIDFCTNLKLQAATITNESCTNPNLGQITVNAINGIEPYTYSWSNSQNGQTAIGLAAGIYTITVQDASNPAQTAIQQYEITKQIEWDYTAGITTSISQNSLTKSATTGTTNSWASSANRFSGDGVVRFTANNITDEYVIGLSKTSKTEGNYYNIDFAWEQFGTNMYLSTIKDGIIGYTPITAGDEFTIKRVGDIIEYFQNDIKFVHQDTLDADAMLSIEASINQQNVVIDEVKVDFCKSMEVATVAVHSTCGESTGLLYANVLSGTSPYSYLWSNGTATNLIQNLEIGSYSVSITDGEQTPVIRQFEIGNKVEWGVSTGVETLGNYVLNKTSVNGTTNAGATSRNKLLSNIDGWGAVEIADITSQYLFGLSNTGWNNVDYGFEISNEIKIYESGSFISSHGASSMGKILKIERTGSVINYYIEGTLIRTVAIGSSQEMSFAARLYNQNDKLEKAFTSFCPQFSATISTTNESIEGYGSVEVAASGSSFVPYKYIFHYPQDTLIDTLSVGFLSELKAGDYWVEIKDTLNDSLGYNFSIGEDLLLEYVSGIDTLGYDSLKSNLFTKSGITGWGEGVIQSANPITSEEGGTIEFEIIDVTTKLALGFKAENSVDRDGYTGLKYGYVLENNQVNIYENGVITQANSTSYTIGDKLSIEKKGTTMVYKKNEVTLKTTFLEGTESFKLHTGIERPGGKVIVKLKPKRKFPYFPRFSTSVSNLKCNDTIAGSITVNVSSYLMAIGTINYNFIDESIGTGITVQNSSSPTLEVLEPGCYKIVVTYQTLFPTRNFTTILYTCVGKKLEYTYSSSLISVNNETVCYNYQEFKDYSYTHVFSENVIQPYADGWFGWNVTDNNSPNIYGVSKSTHDTSTVNYGVKVYEGKLYLTEGFSFELIRSYSSTLLSNNVKIGDRLKIKRENSDIIIIHNEQEYTIASSTDNGNPLFYDVDMPNGTIPLGSNECFSNVTSNTCPVQSCNSNCNIVFTDLVNTEIIGTDIVKMSYTNTGTSFASFNALNPNNDGSICFNIPTKGQEAIGFSTSNHDKGSSPKVGSIDYSMAFSSSGYYFKKKDSILLSGVFEPTDDFMIRRINSSDTSAAIEFIINGVILKSIDVNGNESLILDGYLKSGGFEGLSISFCAEECNLVPDSLAYHVYEGDSVQIGNNDWVNDTSLSFVWDSLSIGLGCYNCAYPWASPDTTTTYNLIIIGDSGCISQFPIIITVTPVPECNPNCNIYFTDLINVDMNAQNSVSSLLSDSSSSFASYNKLNSGIDGVLCYPYIQGALESTEFAIGFSTVNHDQGLTPDPNSIDYSIYFDGHFISIKNQDSLLYGPIQVFGNQDIKLRRVNSNNTNASIQVTIGGVLIVSVAVNGAEELILDGYMKNASFDSLSISFCPEECAITAEGSEYSILQGEGVAIGNSTWLGESSYIFLWDSTQLGLSCYDCAYPWASPDTTTTYNLTVISDSGCIKQFPIIVSVTPVPECDPSCIIYFKDLVNAEVTNPNSISLLEYSVGGSFASYNKLPASIDGVLCYTYKQNFDETSHSVVGFSTANHDKNLLPDPSSIDYRLEIQGQYLSFWNRNTLIMSNRYLSGDTDIMLRRVNSNEVFGEMQLIINGLFDCSTTVDSSEELILDGYLSKASFDSLAISFCSENCGIVTDLDYYICPGDSINIGNISWLTDTTYTFIWDSTQTGLDCYACGYPLAKPDTTTTYHLTVIGANGCLQQIQITVNIVPLPSVSSDSPEQTCVATSVQLFATGGTSYEWIPGFGLSDSTIYNPIASPDTTTQYQVVIVDSLGCNATDTLTYIVEITDSIFQILPDTFICFGESIFLSSDGKGTFSWTPSASLNNPSISEPLATPTTSTTYSVQFNDSLGCFATSFATVQIDVIPLPTAVLSSPISICEGVSTQLSATNAALNYHWLNAVSLDNPFIYNPIVTPEITTDYEVELTDEYGCKDTLTILITVLPKPTLSVSNDTVLCSNETLQLSAIGANTYSWTPISFLNDPNVATPNVLGGGSLSCEIVVDYFKVSDTTGNFFGALENGDLFGHDVANIGDLNLDGRVDVAVGAPGNENGCINGNCNEGAVWIQFMNSSGLFNSNKIDKYSLSKWGEDSVIQFNVRPYDYFGWSVDNIGDLNNDGVTDLIVGAPGSDTSSVASQYDNIGAVYILFMDINGGVKSHSKITYGTAGFLGTIDNNSKFGSGVAGIGDINGDGNEDVLVGSEGSNSVWILMMNANGTVLNSQQITNSVGGLTSSLMVGDLFGASVDAIGDIDNDGVVDIIIGAPGDDASGVNHGAVYIIFLNSNGTVKAEQKIMETTDGVNINVADNQSIGYGVAGVGDINGDGIKDVTIAQTSYNSEEGKVLTCYLNPDGTVKSNDPITQYVNGFDNELEPDDLFGYAVDGMDNFFNNGAFDIVVGAPRSDDGGPYRGAFWMIDLVAPCIPSSIIHYEVTGMDVNGCKSDETIDVTILPSPTVVATVNNTACLDEGVQLTGSGATNYLWTPSELLNNASSSNPVATITNQTTFYVMGSDSENSCFDSDSVIVSAPILMSAGNDATVCFRENTVLSASGGVSYFWYPSVGLSSTSISNPTANILSTITYYCVITNANGCIDTSDVTITVDPNCLCNVSPGAGINYTWIGGTSSNWADATNWSPNGIPGNGIGDNVIIVSGDSITNLDQDRTINNLCVLTGILNLNSFILKVEGNGTFIGGVVESDGNNVNYAGNVSGLLYMDRSSGLLKAAYFYGTLFNAPVRVEKCNELYLNGSVFNKHISVLQDGNLTVECSGGNQFNGVAEIYNSGSGILRLAGTLSGTPDAYNNNVTFGNSGTGALYPSSKLKESYKGNIEILDDNIVFGINGGIVVLNGLNHQIISGNNLPENPLFKKLEMTKTITSNLILDIPITVGSGTGDYLNLKEGKIVTALDKLLTINYLVEVQNASNESFVEGPVRKIGNDNFMFPTGKGLAYTPIGISNASTASSSAEFIAEFISQQQNMGTFITPLQQISTCSYWTLTRQVGTGNVDITLAWLPFTCDITLDITKMHVASWNGTNWASLGNESYTGSKLSGGTVRGATATSLFNAFILGSDVLPENGPTMGMSFNNYGVNVNITTANYLNVYGNILNEEGFIAEPGSFSNAGKINLRNDWTNNVNNDAFDAANGSVEMFGSYQRIRGTDRTQYYNLTAGGHGKKEMFADVSVDGILDLTENQIQTRNHLLYVNTALSSAIVRTNGYISSLDGGFLGRDMNTTDLYLFPVGEPYKYRPIEITPEDANNNTFNVRMDHHDPSADGFDRAIKSPDIQSINDKYYHWMERTAGNSPVKIEMYFDGDAEGQFQNIGHWDDQPIGPTYFAPDPPVWKRTDNFMLNLKSLPLLSSVIVNQWTDFNNPQFSLVRAGFIINTGGFGEPGGVTYTMGGSGFGSTGPTYGTGDGTGNTDGTGGNTVTPNDLAGTHIMSIDGGPYSTDGAIEIEIDNTGTITSLTFIDENDISNTLSDELYDVINGNILVLKSIPAEDLVCTGDISIQLGANKMVLKQGTDVLSVNGVDVTDPNAMLKIYNKAGVEVASLAGADIIGSPWGGGGTAGVYRYELTVSKLDGGTHTFKGQFFVEN